MPTVEPRLAPMRAGSGRWAMRMLAPLVPVLAAVLWLAVSFRVVMGLLLVGHALIHTGYLTPPPDAKPDAPPWPFRLDRSWLLSRLGPRSPVTRMIGMVLVAVTVAGSVTAAVGLLTGQEWWQGSAVASAAASLVLLGLYAHPLLLLGFIVDALILSVVVLRWPAAGYVG
jgi:hypothetical protein